jgi:glycosyltransferase involved in cell wall biosynthesis
MPEAEPDSLKHLAVVYLGHRGGGARFCLDLTLGLASRADVATHVLLTRNNALLPQFAFLGSRVFLMQGFATMGELLVRSLWYPFTLISAARFMRSKRIDAALFVMHNPWNAGLMLVCRALRIPYGYVVHDAVLHEGENAFLRRAVLHLEIALSDRFMCLSETVAQQFQATFGIDSRNICVVPHGARSASSPRTTAQSDGPLRLLFFGRIVAYKGLELLYDALRLLREAGTPFELQIAGEGPISPRVASMQEWPNVQIANRFVDEPEIEPCFARAHVLVVPYIEASQSGVIPLAFSFGVPVVCTPVGGLREQVKDGHDGLLAQEVSAQALANLIQRLHENRKLLANLAAGARRTAQIDLDWSTLVTPLISFLTRRRPDRVST